MSNSPLCLLIVACTLVACSDDPTGPKDATGATLLDAADTMFDPCDPNPCIDPPPADCSDDRRVARSFVTPGTCSVVNGGATCGYDTFAEICGNDGFCSLGVCDHFGTLCDYPLDGRWSYGVRLAFGGQADQRDPDTGEPVDQCCVDMDGDGVIDNAFGEKMKDIEPLLGVNFNDFLAQRIESLTTVSLFELRGPPANEVGDLSGRFDIIGFDGIRKGDGDFTTCAAGDCTFAIRETSSVVPNTVTPLIHFVLDVEGGHIVGGNGVFAVPFGIGARNAKFHLTSFEGSLSLDGAGRGFSLDGVDGGMRVGAHFTQADMLAVFNGAAIDTCPCTTWENGQPIDIPNLGCNAPTAQTCAASDPFCRFMATTTGCEVVLQLSTPDLDVDGDGIDDAISAGMRMRSVPAHVVSDGCP